MELAAFPHQIVFAVLSHFPQTGLNGDTIVSGESLGYCAVLVIEDILLKFLDYG